MDKEIEKNSVFLFGTGSLKLSEALKKLGIKVERVLGGCTPFAIVGDAEEEMQKYLQGCIYPEQIIQIKKNFSNLLSRDVDNYESNYNSYNQPAGVEVYERNRSDYLIIYFSDVMRNLYKVDSVNYSLWGDPNYDQFMADVIKHEMISFPFPPVFNWKYYIERFAYSCLENYKSDHIILVRTSISDWYIDGMNIVSLDKSQQDVRGYIERVEDYFLECTNCHQVRDLYCYPRDKKSETPDFSVVYQPSDFALGEVARSICSIIQNGDDYRTWNSRQSLLKKLMNKLTDEKKMVFLDNIKAYDCKNDVEIENHFCKNHSDESFEALHKLSVFLKDDGYSLTEYLKERNVDIEIFELYTEYFRLDSSDLIAVCMLYDKLRDKSVLTRTIRNICRNSNCYPTNAMNDFINANKKYLSEYNFLDDDLKAYLKAETNQEARYARLTENFIVRFQFSVEPFITYISWQKSMPSVDKIVQGRMMCSIYEVDDISKSWKFYIERAKEGKANVPLQVVVREKELSNSMLFLNFRQILESENALIVLEKNEGKKKYEGYRSRCNLGILMNPKVKIFFVANGMSDQMDFYLFSKYIQMLNKEVIPVYDDLYARRRAAMGGFQVEEIANEEKKDLSSRMLSNIISKQLYMNYPLERSSFCDFLYENGWNDIIGVTARHMVSWEDYLRKCSHLIVTCGYTDGEEGFDERVARNPLYKYYFYHTWADTFYNNRKEIIKWIKFPAFDDEKNAVIAKEMMSCDAVVLHIRCGDYINNRTYNANPMPQFYYECIKRVIGIKEYKNKKYYIFSDDMKWVKEHHDELGLGLVDEKDIRYVTHNRRSKSFWDLKLISLGKIIFVGIGAFGRKGVLLSDRKEIALSMDKFVNERWKKMGWKNKYDFGNGIK